MQLHLRFAKSAGDWDEFAKEGLVWISSDRIAESRSPSVDAAPCMFVPPVMLTLVLAGAGEDALDDFVDALVGGASMSEINGPEAEGGTLFETAFEGPPEDILGDWTASGLSCRANEDAKGCLGRFLCCEDEVM